MCATSTVHRKQIRRVTPCTALNSMLKPEAPEIIRMRKAIGILRNVHEIMHSNPTSQQSKLFLIVDDKTICQVVKKGQFIMSPHAMVENKLRHPCKELPQMVVHRFQQACQNYLGVRVRKLYILFSLPVAKSTTQPKGNSAIF